MINARVWRNYLMLVTATAFWHLNEISFCSQHQWLGWTRRGGNPMIGGCFSEAPSIAIASGERTCYTSFTWRNILTSIMSDNGPTPQDDAERVCASKIWISKRHSAFIVPLDSFEEASKAAGECERYSTVVRIWLLTTCNLTPRNRKAQTNPSTLYFCHSSSTDRSLSSACSWSRKEENNSDKTWPGSLGTWIHR